MFGGADKWRVMNAEVTETQSAQRKTLKMLVLCVKYPVIFLKVACF